MRHSESIDKIAPALLAAQKELPAVKKTANNPFYSSKYAPLDEILEEIIPIYNKHGMVIMQDVSPDGSISTFILHESGQWMQQDGMNLPLDKQTPQGAGSAVTYGRRYTLKAMTGLADDDDDGNSAEKNKKTVAPKTSTANEKYFLDNDNAPTKEAYTGWTKTMTKEEIIEKYGYFFKRTDGKYDWYSVKNKSEKGAA